MNRRARRDGGFAMIDAMMALMVLTTGVFTCVAFFRSQVREIRYEQDRTAAALIAESEIERLVTLPFGEIVSDPALKPALPSAERLKKSSAALTVEEIEPGLKEATVRVEWETAKGARMGVQLARWFSREGEGL